MGGRSSRRPSRRGVIANSRTSTAPAPWRPSRGRAGPPSARRLPGASGHRRRRAPPRAPRRGGPSAVAWRWGRTTRPMGWRVAPRRSTRTVRSLAATGAIVTTAQRGAAAAGSERGRHRRGHGRRQPVGRDFGPQARILGILRDEDRCLTTPRSRRPPGRPSTAPGLPLRGGVARRPARAGSARCRRRRRRSGGRRVGREGRGRARRGRRAPRATPCRPSRARSPRGCAGLPLPQPERDARG